ncbi:Protein disulfide-isomerase [Apis cerana cerana]|uniref:Protein disulfide-isomerase n=1 Tax=Apis cerana cerana TaxID=94128 RepID=A0A2A3E777_APICC|nr:Protein disulfide-isomerase [Apis cerana cerana]
MVIITKLMFIAVIYGIFTSVIASRVLELSDRFLDIHKDGQWLVMMYAPWCAHCKRLEPIWAHVAQYLHATSIRVGRVDCTRFTNVAHAFKVKGFPTIIL